MAEFISISRLNGYSKEFSPDELQLGKKQIDSLQKLHHSLPIHSAVPMKYTKPENVQTGQTARQVYSWITDSKCDISADTVFMSSLSDHKHPNQVDS